MIDVTPAMAMSIGLAVSATSYVCSPHVRCSTAIRSMQIRRLLRQGLVFLAKKPETTPKDLEGNTKNRPILLRLLALFVKEPAAPVGVLIFHTERGAAKIEYLKSHAGKWAFFRSHRDDKRLAHILHKYRSMCAVERHIALQYILEVIRLKARTGRLMDLVQSSSHAVRLMVAPYAFDIRTSTGMTSALADIPRSDFRRGIVTYRLSDGALEADDFVKREELFKQLLGSDIIIRATEGVPGAVTVRRLPKLPEVIPMRHPLIERARKAHPGDILLGVDIESGEPVFMPLVKFEHVQICGVPGYGKTTFLHQVITQFMECDRREIEHVTLVDLKMGKEFKRYRNTDGRFDIQWDFHKVAECVSDLEDAMNDRLEDKVETRGKLVLIIDEFAQLGDWPLPKHEHENVRVPLLRTLKRISMLGRAAGVLLIFATQKLTADAMTAAPIRARTLSGDEQWVSASGARYVLKRDKRDPVCVTVLGPNQGDRAQFRKAPVPA